MRKQILSLLLAVCLVVPLWTTPASAATVASGTCGGTSSADLVWVLDSDGTLTISLGAGVSYDANDWKTGIEMASYSESNPAPWYDYRASITSVVIEEGVGYVHNAAFEDCTNLTTITIPYSMYAMDYCFVNCPSLTDVFYAGSIDEFYWRNNVTRGIDNSAFVEIDGSQFYVNCVRTNGTYSFVNCSVNIHLGNTASSGSSTGSGTSSSSSGGSDTSSNSSNSSSGSSSGSSSSSSGSSSSGSSSSSSSSSNTTPFTDISGHRYQSAIVAVYEAGLMVGITDATFEPDTTLTRAMLVTTLYRLASSPDTGNSSSYRDVDSDAWYASAVSWATATGLVTGYEDGTFRPTDAVTREQLAVFFYRFASNTGLDVSKTASLNSYADAGSVRAYAEIAVRWAVAISALEGRSSGLLNPDEAATRAEVAQALYILIK